MIERENQQAPKRGGLMVGISESNLGRNLGIPVEEPLITSSLEMLGVRSVITLNHNNYGSI